MNRINLVIARSGSDEAIQERPRWIALLTLAMTRAG
jgi:hypothetical protein